MPIAGDRVFFKVKSGQIMNGVYKGKDKKGKKGDKCRGNILVDNILVSVPIGSLYPTRMGAINDPWQMYGKNTTPELDDLRCRDINE